MSTQKNNYEDTARGPFVLAETCDSACITVAKLTRVCEACDVRLPFWSNIQYNNVQSVFVGAKNIYASTLLLSRSAEKIIVYRRFKHRPMPNCRANAKIIIITIMIKNKTTKLTTIVRWLANVSAVRVAKSNRATKHTRCEKPGKCTIIRCMRMLMFGRLLMV